MINRRWPLENIFRPWITTVSYNDRCETFRGRSMDSWVHSCVKRVCFILRTASPGGRQPYFSPDFNAQPTFTNLFIDYRSLLKLITIKLNRNQKRSTTPVSHIKVVTWLRTDSNTWQVLIKYGPLVPEGERRDHRWTTLTFFKFNCQYRGEQWPSTIFG